ncbi:hypothetical protein HGM15179_006903 [Zosterops borbonicus]|uniref:Uncharacterized protein n=1 Tax=Zosterops borbonicus TaxID=364589 RepID=A0A8K1GLK3_9PASS|nr:hypothetical protein HGM15179_006903 [Zosterops borbonicus]
MLEQAPGRRLQGHGKRRPAWSRFAGRACGAMGDPWNSLLLKDYIPLKRPTLEQFVMNCSLWESLMLEKSMGDCLLWDGPNTGTAEGLLSLKRKQLQKKREMN